jgi:pSer/pThr/pTyr-binding forkhead associated (FHA) protein
VNRNRIVKAKLNHGDEITIGKTVFKFALEEDAKVRHISTIFKSQHHTESGPKASLVDTLIEDEVRKKRSYFIVLQIKYSDGSRDRIELPQKQVYLGRATTFGKFESDAEISRKHALIKLNDHGEIFVEDQGSTNGTYLNGAKIRGMHPVKATDVIKIGGIEVLASVKTG